jgi:cation transport ATPase
MARASSSSCRALACTISLRSAGELAAPALPRGRPVAHHVPRRSGYRPGQQHLARFLVRGDLVILAEGDRVPADATVLSAHDLQCDGSLLMGEAAPVSKIASPGAPPVRPGADDLPYIYSGSLVVRGHGRAEVTATGRAARSARSASRLRGWIPSRRGRGSR